MTAIERGFRELIGPFRLEQLERSSSPVCGLWPDLRIAYTNPAWSGFAAANDGHASPLGSGYLDPVAPVLQPFYERLLRDALTGGERVDHDYECSTADAFRIFRMSVYPLPQGLIVAHTGVVDEPHPDPGMPPVEARYRDADGLMRQCAHCRRTRRVTGDAWDWVPEFVRHLPEGVSHGLCPPCTAYYYADWV